jgi:hypothetical protein
MRILENWPSRRLRHWRLADSDAERQSLLTLCTFVFLRNNTSTGIIGTSDLTNTMFIRGVGVRPARSTPDHPVVLLISFAILTCLYSAATSTTTIMSRTVTVPMNKDA